MSLIAVGSLRGAPGTTTAVVALAAVWEHAGRQPFVLEADPDGGVLAARFALGHHPSLTELGSRARAGLSDADVWSFAQPLPGGIPVVVAHPSAEQCHAALRAAAGRIGERLADCDGYDVLADVGRLRPGSPAAGLVEHAALLLVVMRPRLEDVDAAARRLAVLNGHGNVGLVLVGNRPYSAAEVAGAVGAPVIGVLASDARSAAALGGQGSGRSLARLPLLRSARALADEVIERLAAAEALAVSGS